MRVAMMMIIDADKLVLVVMPLQLLLAGATTANDSMLLVDRRWNKCLSW